VGRRGSPLGERFAPQRPGRGRHRLSLPVVLVTAGAAALSGCGTATSSANHSETVSTATRTTTRAFSVTVEAGSLRLIPGPAGLVSMRGTVAYRGGQPPSISWQSSGGKVLLSSVCHSRGGDCDYSYTISVPVSTMVHANVMAGDIWASGLAGTLDLNAPAGNVTLAEVSGPVRVTGGSGNVTGAGLRSSNSDVELGTGNVTLGFTAAPSRLAAGTGTGNVAVMVPPAFRYHVVTSDQLGNVSLGIADDPSSPRVVSLSVGTGNLFLNESGG